MIQKTTLIITLFCTVLVLSIKAQKQDTLQAEVFYMEKDSARNAAFDTKQSERLILFARKYIGRPYSYGSTSGKSFDCSGFTQHVFSSIGVVLPHSSGAQFSTCKKIEINEVQKGDLLFFSGRNAGSKTIGHVSLVTEVQGERIRMIHVTTHGGVMEEWMNDSKYFQPRLLVAGKLLQATVATDTVKIPEIEQKAKKKVKRKKRRK